MSAQFVGPSLRAYYRCDKVVKEHLEGNILWTGPSEHHVLLIETEPRDFLADPDLVDTMKKKMFFSLKQQPYVQALLQEGDTLGLAHCEILYKHQFSWLTGHARMNSTHLSRDYQIAIESDELGSYADLWITMTLVVNSSDATHSVSPIRPRLCFGPGDTFNCGDTGDLATNAAIRAQEAEEAEKNA